MQISSVSSNIKRLRQHRAQRFVAGEVDVLACDGGAQDNQAGEDWPPLLAVITDD